MTSGRALNYLYAKGPDSHALWRSMAGSLQCFLAVRPKNFDETMEQVLVERFFDSFGVLPCALPVAGTV